MKFERVCCCYVADFLGIGKSHFKRFFVAWRQANREMDFNVYS